MPLVHSKSKAAREKNIAAEIHAGKSPAQAMAIGYSIQRHAGHRSTPKHKGAPDGSGARTRAG